MGVRGSYLVFLISERAAITAQPTAAACHCEREKAAVVFNSDE